MGTTIIQIQADGSALLSHVRIEGLQPAGEYRARHPRFRLVVYPTGSLLLPLKHRGFMLQPITGSGCLSELFLLERILVGAVLIGAHKYGDPPFTHLATTTFLPLQVECLVRQHLIKEPSFIHIVYVGGLIFMQNIFGTFLHQISSQLSCIHDDAASVSTLADSPDSTSATMQCRALNRLGQPALALKLLCPNMHTKSIAFCCEMLPTKAACLLAHLGTTEIGPCPRLRRSALLRSCVMCALHSAVPP